MLKDRRLGLDLMPDGPELKPYSLRKLMAPASGSGGLLILLLVAAFGCVTGAALHAVSEMAGQS